MCGIGGKLSFQRRPRADLPERMASRIRHRGPDDQGVYAHGPIVLAHRRLSILDLSRAGRQPMSNDDETIHVVFNGEIYNYRELRDRVPGDSFRTGTDTEVLLRLYEEYGVDCLPMLRGMFAFAIWDERAERLFLARDRLGQKPLFYRVDDGAFWFGSTISTLLADDEVTAEPDLAAIRSYLTYQYVPHPKTGFDGIERLAPSEYMLVSKDEIRRRRYWSVSFSDQFTDGPGVIADRLRTKLREATRLRMRSDVPVGVFLSGGIDSSIVAALMADIADRPIETYSIGFDVENYDELEFARTVADAYDTNHHEYTVVPDSMDVLPDLVEHYEMPFGDPSALPTFYVSQMASDDITVALTGDAGDENFAGYDRYSVDRLAGAASHVPRPLRTTALDGLSSLPDPLNRLTYTKYAKRFLDSTTGDSVERYAHFICHALDGDVDQVWQGPEPIDELSCIRKKFEATDGPTRLDTLMHVDLESYLPDDLLVKVDRASMAHSLETRSPFLDHEVVSFAARIPARYKWQKGKNKKWILKRAFGDILPQKIVSRSKQGFGVPIDEWFRGELREFARETLDGLGSREPFDRSGLHRKLDAHVSGVENNEYQLWDLVMLEHWYRRFID